MIEHQVTPRCLSTVKGDSSRLVYEVTLGKPPWSLVVRGVKTLSCILSPLAISDKDLAGGAFTLSTATAATVRSTIRRLREMQGEDRA
jgi:hypothetical protein